MKKVPISTISISVFLLFLLLASCDYMNPSSGFNNEDYTILKNFNTDTLPLLTLDSLDATFLIKTKSTRAFRLSVENSKTFNIEATATTSGCCGFSILDSSFNPVYTRSSIYSSDPPVITYISKGTYFLVLRNNCTSSGDISITLRNEDYTILKNFNSDTLPSVTLDSLDATFMFKTKSTRAFRLSVENSRTFYIEATSSSSGCTGFSILDSTFKSGYSSNYIYSSDPAVMTYISKGTYFLVLKNNCTSSGDISITLRVDISEPDDTRATARMVEVNGNSLIGSLRSYDTDMFKFVAQKDSFYTIAVNNSPNTRLTLFRSDSSLFGSVNGSTDTSILSFKCTVPGTYYFTVTKNYSSNQQIGYTCSVVTHPVDSFEPDDSIYQAKILPDDGTVQTHTTFAGDADWMKCKIRQGYYYLLKVNGAKFGTGIYADKNALITTLAANDSLFLWGVAPSDSIVYIKAGNEQSYEYNGSNIRFNSYTISATELPVDQYEPDDNPINAHKIEIGKEVFKSALIKNDIDWVKFAAKAGSTYDVLETGNSPFIVGIYNSSVLANVSSRSPGSHNVFTAPGNDTIYLKIGERSRTGINTFKSTETTKSPKNEYSIKVNVLQSDTFEYDNTLKYAKSITVNGVIQKRIFTADDTDAITFNAIADSAYLINVSNTCRIQLYSDSSTILRSQYSATPSMGITLTWMCTRSGMYYFDAMYPYYVDSLISHYTTSVKTFRNDLFEPDNIMSMATLLDTSKTPQTHSLIQNDIDWFKYTVTPGMILKITGTGTSILPTLSMRGKNEILYKGDSLPSFLYAQDTILNEFYIRVGPLTDKLINAHGYDSPTYQYSLNMIPIYNDSYEPDNSLKTASTVKLNEAAQSRILLYKETDYIKMDAVKDSSYKITFNDILKMSLIHSSGTVLHNRTWPNAGSVNSFSWTCLEGGAYFIKIDSSSQKWNIRDSLKINYKVSFESAHGDNYEPDNTPETARLINIDTVRQHHTLFVMDEDWMKFTGVKGIGYQFFCEQQLNTSPYVTMSLYGSDGKTMYQNSMSSGTMWNCPADGDYFLKFQVDFKAAVNNSEWEYSTYLQKTSLP